MPVWLPSWLVGRSEDGTGSAGSQRIKIRSTLVRRLNDVQHLTAVPLAAFLFVHLAAAAALPLAGSEGATQVMVLGRELYQTPFGESFLTTAFLVHAVAGVLKRLLLLPAPPPTLQHKFAYPLAALVIVHTASNRLQAPSSGGADFHFVKLGITEWPWRAGLVYAGVVGLGLGHAFGAGWAAWRRRFGTGGLDRRRVAVVGKWIYMGMLSWLAFGMGALVMEKAGEKPAWIMEQYRSAWRNVPLYR